MRTNADSFADAVTAAIDLGGDTDTVAAVAGALAGARVGIQGIPSHLHGHITTPDGRRTYHARDLQDLTMRLLGGTGAPETPLGPREGPTEIDTGVFAADFGAASGVDRDWAVLSLCRVGGCFSDHSVRREVYLIDKDDDHNPALASVAEDCVSTIDAWRAEGRTVLVHCHGGSSRTGLILRAWLMHRRGWSSVQATEYLKSRWPCLGEWNESFTAFLDGWR